MEPAAAKMIWSRSSEKRKLCSITFIGDGDSKSYSEILQLNPYDSIPIHKEECTTHVSKRLKKTLCKIKKNTANKSYVQCKLSEPKADYISSTYSAVIFQTGANQLLSCVKLFLSFWTMFAVIIPTAQKTHGADGDNLHPQQNHHPLQYQLHTC
ncbi:hypothetical protein LOD99_3993 [Oopsacas minuta]|uniref:Mutator-like transposase domain-containing protein n=1 Tax=Oopsacas minuta TaxID=111878 RepID=A0AAV7JY58_9METZ|nr:hypothetical protein LOD99_3993 [Oopsacas minuta]